MSAPDRSSGRASSLRVLVVAPFSLEIEGGAATVVHALTRGLRARGHECTEVSSWRRPPPAVLAQWADVHTPGAARELVELVELHGPDVVHLHNFAGGLSARAAGVLARRMAGKTAVVMTLHDHYSLCHRGGMVTARGNICPGPGTRCLWCVGRQGRKEIHRPRRLAAIRRHLAPPLALVSPSEDGRALLTSHGHGHAVSIPNGVDLESFRPPEEGAPGSGGADPVQVLVVGRASPAKGVHVMHEAARQLAAGDVRVRWIGARAPAAARQLGGAFTGGDPVPHERLPDLYRAADIVCVPSLARETFGLAAVEAMACGRAVVASDRGGLPEVVGDAGVLVPAGDAGALAGALARLAADAGERRRLGSLAAARARGLFSWELAVDRYLELYRRRLGGGEK